MRPKPRYDLAVILNYYAPYVSGLTEVARIVAEGLAERGWRVAVVTSKHDDTLAPREVLGGVEVIRCPVAARIGRGVVCPTFPDVAARIARQSSVAHLHLPMLEGGLVARLAGLTPVVSTYHIDLWLPPGALNALQVAVMDAAARDAMRHSVAVVVNSDDQARHSKLWPVMAARGLHAVPAPCLDRRGGQPSFREGPGQHIGFLGRIVEDKGLEYLVSAFRQIADPDARLLIGGDYEKVAGGGILERVLTSAGDDPRVRILGLLRDRQINDFYASIDTFALPSVAESFGIVQAEAMMTGVPSATTDLPGGRYPVLATQFGRLVPPRDPQALTRALLELSKITPEQRREGAESARAQFGVTACLDAYESLLTSVAARSAAPLDAPATSRVIRRPLKAALNGRLRRRHRRLGRPRVLREGASGAARSS
jgi:glycosyltransferase involved in cell wall biosynthesis